MGKDILSKGDIMSPNQQSLFVIKGIKSLRHRNRKNYNQYFTPEFAVEKALSLVPTTDIKNIIDPAVGNGVFLKIASLKWKRAKLFGVDIDPLVIHTLKKTALSNSVIFAGNSLLEATWEKTKINKIISDGGFDLVVGNPPFSSWFQRIESKEILSTYDLAKNNGHLRKSLAVEILFTEKFISLTKNGGFIVVILPDGVLSNLKYQYVREFILKNTQVLHIINLPRNVFEDTSAKTSILILNKQKKNNLNYSVKAHDLEKTGEVNNTIKVLAKDLLKRMDYYYYYNLQKSHLQELMGDEMVKPLKDFAIYCKTGRTVYGKERRFIKKGLRFLHSTNITKIGTDYKKDEKFIKPKSSMDIKGAYIKAGDILIVRVGDGCVGRTAIVAEQKDIGVVSDCIFILRVKGISPFYVTIFLKTRFGKDWFKINKHGSATTCINRNEILSIPIPVLNKNIQKAIGIRYKKIIRRSNNGNKDNFKAYQQFEQLIKDTEAEIINGKSI